jgi:hypothetical protein
MRFGVRHYSTHGAQESGAEAYARSDGADEHDAHMLRLGARKRNRHAGDKCRDPPDRTRRAAVAQRQYGDRSAERQGANDQPADDRRGRAGRDSNQRGCSTRSRSRPAPTTQR